MLAVSPVQLLPSPEKPDLQKQLYPPSILVHVASESQLAAHSVHSFTSTGEVNTVVQLV